MNKKERRYAQIRQHGENLNALFGLSEDPVALCKKLHRLETQARNLSVQENNGEIDLSTWIRETNIILDKVDKITGFREKGIPVFAQGDGRGNALQIDDAYLWKNRVRIYINMGGCGILAPTFDGED